jgi:hypothetical protein
VREKASGARRSPASELVLRALPIAQRSGTTERRGPSGGTSARWDILGVPTRSSEGRANETTEQEVGGHSLDEV